ncbi:ABC transporter permease [Desulfococcaceae bacterium HSG9]|nr:ABC transporter permease [Desulfococcaceae bacterium HSG9]
MGSSKPATLIQGNAAKKKKKIFSLEVPIYMGPIISILAVFVFAPLLIILFYSFLKTGPYGEIVYEFTLQNISAVLGAGYGSVYLTSLYLAFQTNIICILLGYPLAYYIARYGGQWKVFLISMIVIPSWVAYLIRLYALKTIAGNKGIINSFLLNMGIISDPLEMLYTPFIVMVGLVYTWLPFMILPLHASLEGLDPSLLEAATDLGANPMRRFFRIILPLTRGGLIAGSILVFIPTLGDWLVPNLLGGSKVMMAGNLVANQFTVAGNVPVGSSLAIMLAATLILILYLALKWGGKEAMERLV